MNVRTRYGLVRLRECGELLYGKKYAIKLKGAAYKSYGDTTGF